MLGTDPSRPPHCHKSNSDDCYSLALALGLLMHRSLPLSVLALFALAAAARAQDETVIVTGERTLALAKLTEPLLTTPQTIAVIPSAVMQDEAAFDLRDVLRNDPEISLHADEDSGQGTNVTIRGFSARYDTYLDGMLDAGSYYRDGFDLAEVDVLTGPSSALFGRGSTGGAIDQVTKTPGLDAFAKVSATGGDDGTARLTADIDAPLGPTAALRLNALSYQGGIAGRAIARNDRVGLAPSLAFGIGTKLRVTLSYLHQSEWDVPDYGVPWIDVAGETVSEPTHPAHQAFYGFTSDRAYDDVDVGTLSVERDFGDFSLGEKLRYGAYQRRYRATDPTIGPLVAAGTPDAAIAVTRTMRGGYSTETTLDDQLDATAHFEAFGIGHALVAGLEAARFTASPTQFKYGGVPATTLADPDPDQPFAGAQAIKSQVHAAVDTLSAYAIDTAKFGAFAVTGAVRLDDFNAQYRNAVPAQYLQHADAVASYKAALVYNPTQAASLYADFGTSFDPSAESVSLSAATAGLGPERSHTIETGVKWNAEPGLLVSAALFRTVMNNLREPSPSDPSVDVLEGEAEAQGADLSLQGRIGEAWTILGGYTYLDGRVLRSPDPDAGATLQNAPRHSVKLWTSYAVPLGFTIGAGVNYQSSRVPGTLPDANGLMQKVPGYWTASAMLRLPLGAHFSAQLNIDNIADAYYYDNLDDDHVNLGAGRSVLLTLGAAY